MNFVIFGGTGDLAYRKLIPALYNLMLDGLLPKNINVYGVGSKYLGDEEYRKTAIEKIKLYSRREFDQKICEEKIKCLKYIQSDIRSDDAYMSFSEIFSIKENIFYLAVDPELYKPIIHTIKNASLNVQNGKYAKVIIEKPFGWSLKTAVEINHTISSIFPEESIYRIDHYLGKEMTRNISVIRFANEIFEALLCSRYIANIQVIINEDIGILDRGRYYDKTGAIRDMFQNHLLQLLCLATMEKPSSLNSEDVIDQKVRILDALKICEKNKSEDLIIGQYDGYREEKDIKIDSETETYIAVKISIDNTRWKDTDIFLSTGKMLENKLATIVYNFRKSDSNIYGSKIDRNKIEILIQPNEGISIGFNIKQPGNENIVNQVKMDFCHECFYGSNTPEAYEKLLDDVFRNDKTSFTRWDEVKAAWSFVDRIIDIIEKDKKSFLKIYTKRSRGPEGYERFTGNV